MAVMTGLTIEEFEALPECLVHNRELVKGALVDVSGNIGGHNDLRDLLGEKLRPWVRSRKLGRVLTEQEYQFEDDARAPDVSFFTQQKAALYDRNVRVQRFVPDLAIEIASKSETFESLLEKLQLYLRCGTQEAWIFSLATRQAICQRPSGSVMLTDSDNFESPLLPGLSIPLKDLFDEPWA